MIRDKNDILTWLKNFLVHGDFENVPDDFDILNEIDKSYDRKKERPQDIDEKDGGRRTVDTKPQISSEHPKDLPLDSVIQFGNEDEVLKLLRSTLQDIRDFETELDNSFEKLNDKFNDKNYQL